MKYGPAFAYIKPGPVHFFWSKKINKTRPYLFIYIFNLGDELYKEFYLILTIIIIIY